MAVRPAGEIQFKNATLEMKILPLGSRAIADDIVDIEAEAAVEVGDISASLSASESVSVKAGTSLSFLSATGRAQLLIIEDVTIGTTATTVPIAGATKEVPVAATAEYVSGLLPLFGIQDFSNSDAPQEVDTTNLQSGFGMESALVRSDHTIDISGIQIPADPCLYGIVKPLAKSGGLFGREVYAVVTMPDGEKIVGAAKVKQYQEPGNQNEVKKYSFQLQFQGDSYFWYTPHIFAAPAPAPTP